MELFQQLLSEAKKGYAEADKRLGGWLPGGGTASPITAGSQQAARKIAGKFQSIPSAIAPVVRPIATSPIYKATRDNVVVPVLDVVMEKGIVPAKEGMFARFLSGTSRPLTRIPADTRAAEALINQNLSNFTERDKKLIQLKQATDAWLKKSTPLQQQNEMYSMHGIGAPVTQQQQKEADLLKLHADQLAKNLGMRNAVEYYTASDSGNAERKLNYDPFNYARGNYGEVVDVSTGLTEEQRNLVTKGLMNTLGRYKVEGGRTKGERYDFNSYNVGTPLFAPGSMVGGVIGESTGSRDLADKALKLADEFGFIRPGAGYPVDFKFR